LTAYYIFKTIAVFACALPSNHKYGLINVSSQSGEKCADATIRKDRNKWSGRADLNCRPLAPQARKSTKQYMLG
jgi:hypothetical protein